MNRTEAALNELRATTERAMKWIVGGIALSTVTVALTLLF